MDIGILSLEKRLYWSGAHCEAQEFSFEAHPVFLLFQNSLHVEEYRGYTAQIYSGLPLVVVKRREHPIIQLLQHLL